MSARSSSLLTRLKPGITAINKADADKLPIILNRIAVTFSNQTDGEFRPFSEDEEVKLSEALSISHEELRLLLETSAYILKQATFNLMKLAVLEKHLKEDYGLDENKAEMFVLTWKNQARNIVGALKQKSLFPSQVEAISWMLTTKVSDEEGGCEMRPSSVIDLQLNPDVAGSVRSLLRLDLDQTQLARLYLTLEEVQAKLDGLR